MIKFFRTKRRISIRKLSKLTGISTSHISRLEAGESVPTIRTLKKIAAALKVPPSALYIERGKGMKSRAGVIGELIDLCDGLSMYSLLRLVWIAKHFRKKEDRE